MVLGTRSFVVPQMCIKSSNQNTVPQLKLCFTLFNLVNANEERNQHKKHSLKGLPPILKPKTIEKLLNVAQDIYEGISNAIARRPRVSNVPEETI